jgi:CheY-like chemotaxis protein
MDQNPYPGMTRISRLFLVSARRAPASNAFFGTVTADQGVIIVKSEPHSQGLEPHANSLQLKAILVVDDDQQLASALQWILADENFLVDVAFDGKAALLKVKAHEYDAVICDLKMPRLRGDDFYLQARELRPSLADRFIFITGFATDARIALFLTKHDVKYLVKPFAIQGLINCVRQLLC